ncbi:hypothetical protein I3843_05G155500 [Carya illinoinensis]|uniref:Uncharacterized protein n=1 Tax=Carya illinoinensis TaxID=32201 RepID=A0A8T1QKR0_CARIL|nr:stemmadenine O-acetyltransferase-like [Carya illinoinensis]KAG2707972.1 hypothetical protein I3760_05G170700 [Carya illinoinensis]KAG6654851.1 hypothetical protein CIPAW_05G174400 [Carya illinoinensis]KAG6713761.1 hypothetical protein I3842_05G170200 [Carya illinoinensis]KAG7979921.1 hypothetical protein I3843_05G155500 [Carya illinoinensis]
MKLHVEILSRDTIKPSSPTPHHLRHYTLSFIDQITPQIFMPFILFYSRDVDTDLSCVERQDRIKKSLSEALVLFYPLAGRVKYNSHVECNDEGVDYVEARANCNLSEYLEDPNPSEHNKFLPYELDDANEVALALQVTSFTCGGIVIGLVFAHKVSDASSFFLFINNWAAIARGSSNIAVPRFESVTIFPPETFPSYSASRGTGKNKIAIKRFIFHSAAIADLRSKYSTDNTNIEYPRPTRVEALSAFICNRFLAVTQQEANPNKVCTLIQVANLRTKLEPPLSEIYFGNMSMPTGSVVSNNTKDGFHGIVIPMRDAINKIDMNYVKSFRESTGANGNFITQNSERFRRGEVASLAFTSLCRFPIYDVDFGWGKPVWIGSARLLYANIATFFDTKSGDGIEVWINLEVEDMAKFEVDKELLSYVSSTKVSVD